MTATPPAGVTVEAFLRGRVDALGLGLRLAAGARGLDRVITSPYAQKTGLALAGFDEYLRPGRILIYGESEVRFLESLNPSDRCQTLRKTFRRDNPCLIITGGFNPPAEVIAEADAAAVPVLQTSTPTSTAIAKVTALLEDSLSERTMLHAVLIDILGLGVLIVGESGIGKSECALDLVVRGHRLIADDTVEIRRRAEATLIGSCPELTRHHMELRGLGVINIKDLFGIASTRSSKRIELVVQLERWEPGKEYDRLGLDEPTYEILGLKIPLVKMPVAPGRSVATLVEVAARNQLLRARGRHAARELAARVDEQLRRASPAIEGVPEDEDIRDDVEDGER